MAIEEGSALCHVSSLPLRREREAQLDSDCHVAWKLPFLGVPRYRFKIFKSKGAVLVLFWCFAAQFAYHLSTISPDHKASLTLGNNTVVNPMVIFTMCMLFYPILGWLADVKYGRYQIVRWGMRIMWVMSILFCLTSITMNVIHLPHAVVKYIKPALYIPIFLSLGGVVSNILQFGIDQLVDASSGDIMSFLRWFTWLWFLSGVVAGVSQSCLCPEYESLGYLVFPALITMVVASDFMLNLWLVKEPVSSNPLVLIFRILRYAIKNKYKSASYWDDRPHSRIDVAKDRYGGPFTTEQVEDVKTFLRIISVILAGTFLVALCLSVYPVFNEVIYHLTDKHFVRASSCSHVNCFQRTLVRFAGDAVLTVFLPLFEFVFYPFFKRVFRVSILRKASIGMVFLSFSLAACTAIEFAANHQKQHVTNTTCHLFSNLRDENERNSLPLDYRWMALPIILNAIGQLFIITSTWEFLCAQSPYSMRGFLFGLTYGCLGFFTVVGYGIVQCIAAIARKWLSDGYGCMSWYLLMSSLFVLIILGGFFSVFKCYKKRSRNDSEPNEQCHAVVVNYISE